MMVAEKKGRIIVYTTYLAIAFGMVVGSLLGLIVTRRKVKTDDKWAQI